MSRAGIGVPGVAEQVVDVHRTGIRSSECGDGDVLFLLHGGGGHAEAFSRNVRNLGQHCRAFDDARRASPAPWRGMSNRISPVALAAASLRA